MDASIRHPLLALLAVGWLALSPPAGAEPGAYPADDTAAGASVLQQTLHHSPAETAACLHASDGRVSWPRGLDPTFTEIRHVADGRIEVDQWFAGMRNLYWKTRFELRATDGGTEVQVRMPTGRNLTADYTRSARDLLALCAG